jgi:hypothetical protein
VETAVVRRVQALAALAQKVGPYLLLEILLPGGTLIALLLFLYQRKQLADGAADMPALVSAVGALRTAYRRFAPAWLKARVRSLFRSCKGAPRTHNRISPVCRTSD